MPTEPARYPRIRMRRSRASSWSRELVREHRLAPSDFLWPVFVIEGSGTVQPIASMPGVSRLTIDRLVPAAAEAAALGIPVIALFPMIDPAQKTNDGAASIRADNLVCRAVKAVKQAVPEIGIMCDAALDPFTDHGHDGIMIDGRIANDETVAQLVRQSLVQVEAGCDIIAPSDMMDGRIGAIRDALEAAGHQDTIILSYAAKYASAFYGPFRDAVGSPRQIGKQGKATYQMDAGNGDEALREVALDIAEGADWVMVKPGMPYLDILRRVKERFGMPTFVYQVSGEYAMLKAAAHNGWLDGDRAMMEALLGFKRAGADGILTYAAVDIAKRLKAES